MSNSALGRAYDHLLSALAVVGGMLLAFVFVGVIGDALARAFGSTAGYWVSAVTEYCLPYITLLSAPWLLHQRGHIMIESLTDLFDPRTRRMLEAAICVLCIALCIALAYYTAVLLVENYVRGEKDIRSITIPLWVIFVPFPIGLSLCAVEFARFLFGAERLLAGRGSETEGF